MFMFGSFRNQIEFGIPCPSPEDDIHGISKLPLKMDKNMSHLSYTAS